MAKLSTVKTDQKKAENGVWVPFAEDIELCIASVNNSAFKNERNRLLKPHERRIRAKVITAQQTLNIIKPAYAKHVLVGWKNIEDEDGKEIPYSVEKALELFNKPEYASFFDFVLETAAENELFRVDGIEEAEKNS